MITFLFFALSLLFFALSSTGSSVLSLYAWIPLGMLWIGHFFMSSGDISGLEQINKQWSLHSAKGLIDVEVGALEETKACIVNFKQGDHDSIKKMFHIVQKGTLGVPFDSQLQMSLLALCSELGDPDAAYSVSQHYKSDDGLSEQDENLYFQWLKKAEELGSMSAFKELAEISRGPDSGGGGLLTGVLVGYILSR